MKNLVLKLAILIIAVLFSLHSNGQTIKDTSYISPLSLSGPYSNYHPLYSVGNSKIDTIPTILLCADTSYITGVRIMDNDSIRFDGLTTLANKFSQITSFTIVGYRVQGNILYTITSKNHLIDGITYLDDKKRPLPSSFIVFSFVDRKQ